MSELLNCPHCDAPAKPYSRDPTVIMCTNMRDCGAAANSEAAWNRRVRFAPCRACGGFGLARGGVCWTCGGSCVTATLPTSSERQSAEGVPALSATDEPLLPPEGETSEGVGS